jgi:hypothetical protein
MLRASSAMQRRFALCLLLLTAVLAYGTDRSIQTVDISGTYETSHPRDEYGNVLIHFEHTQSGLVYEGVELPSYRVSLWKQRDDQIWKLRDGLFGTYTTAALSEGDNGLFLLWYSPDDESYAFNKITRIDSRRNIFIGARELSSSDTRTYNVLWRVADSPVPNELPIENLDLEGIYQYFHSATGRVYVRFERTSETITVSRGVEIGTYSVTVLSKVGPLGYCPVKEGLYGGSFDNDSFPLVGTWAADDGQWLIWLNPEAPGRSRRNRIVCRYPNGDIGIGLDEGELKYVEDTVFRRVADLNARIGEYADFINLDQAYYVRLSDSESVVQAQFSPTGIAVSDNPGVSTIYRVSTVNEGSDRTPVESDGLFEGDRFTHVAVVTRDGVGYFRWYSFSLQTTEENMIFDLDTDGSFLLVGGEFGERYIVAEFTTEPSPPREHNP